MGGEGAKLSPWIDPHDRQPFLSFLQGAFNLFMDDEAAGRQRGRQSLRVRFVPPQLHDYKLSVFANVSVSFEERQNEEDAEEDKGWSEYIALLSLSNLRWDQERMPRKRIARCDVRPRPAFNRIREGVNGRNGATTIG